MALAGGTLAGAPLADGGAAPTVDVINRAGAGGIVLVCEHASNLIPPELEGLGLAADALESHIAWDPGALAVAERMSAILDAPLVVQRVSRLVCDCNRPPEAESAMPAWSEVHAVPGNAGLSAEERQRRAALYYQPFHQALAGCLDAHRASPPVLVTVHTFTPVYAGVRRDVAIGILHDTDRRLADRLLRLLRGETALDVRRNAPYGPQDGVTHTLATQGLPRGLLNVMIEVRNDLVVAPEAQQAMAELLSHSVLAALGRLASETGPKHASSAG